MDAYELGKTLGRIEEKLEAHTKQDSDNFTLLASKLDAIHDLPKRARKTAVKWTIGLAGLILTLAQIAQALGFIP